LTAIRRRSQGRPMNMPPATEMGSDTQSGEAPEIIDSTEREFLELLLAYPECLPFVREQLSTDYLGTEMCRKIYDTCCRLADAGIEASFGRLMLEFDEPAVKNLLVELDETSQSKGRHATDPQDLLGELINTFKRKETEKQRPRQITALREGGLDENRQIDMLEEILRQERDRQGITKPTDG